MNIPEYYKQFQSGGQTVETKEVEKPPLKEPLLKEDKEIQKAKSVLSEEDKTKIYQGNGFTVNQLEDWKDKTIYTLAGPVTDGIQHNLIITVEKEVPIDKLDEYADMQIMTLEQELKGCVILKKGMTKLTNKMDAFEVIFKWYPTTDICIYQHQIFVLVEKTAFKMTASFTKKTLATLGSQVERMMLSFNPQSNLK